MNGTTILILCWIGMVCIVILPFFFFSHLIKKGDDFMQNTGDAEDDDDNTITCITVYTANGEILKQYKGKFEVEDEDVGYIYFTDQHGKEHTVYTSSGTIIIGDYQD